MSRLLLALAFAVLAVAGLPPRDTPAVHARADALELLLPGLMARGGSPLDTSLNVQRPPSDDSLPALALAPELPAGARAPGVFPGYAPLLLALLTLLALPGRTAWWLRALALPVLLLPWLWTPWPSGAASLVLRVATAALIAAAATTAALTLLGKPPRGQSVGPEIGLGVVAVVLAALLAGMALTAGSATDREALSFLLERLPAAAAQARPPETLAFDAAHLRSVLDRGAVAAFVGMTALLIHLKSRRGWTLALLLVVSLADVLSVRRFF
ncbi:MAG: hypothetical protein ACT4PU_11045 [Planctomycetota bacterium]